MEWGKSKVDADGSMQVPMGTDDAKRRREEMLARTLEFRTNFLAWVHTHLPEASAVEDQLDNDLRCICVGLSTTLLNLGLPVVPEMAPYFMSAISCGAIQGWRLAQGDEDLALYNTPM
jgi:hypothetical protein